MGPGIALPSAMASPLGHATDRMGAGLQRHVRGGAASCGSRNVMDRALPSYLRLPVSPNNRGERGDTDIATEEDV